MTFEAMSSSDNSFVHEDPNNRLFVARIRRPLVHRIEELGLELPESGRSPAQQKLWEIAKDQGWEPAVRIAPNGMPHPCRPHWAGGAFLFCIKLDAYALKLLVEQSEGGIIDEDIGKLASKYIVCSPEVWPIFDEVLSMELPLEEQASGREKNLRRKVADVQKVFEVTLPTYVTLSDDVWKAPDVLNEDELEYLTTLKSASPRFSRSQNR